MSQSMRDLGKEIASQQAALAWADPRCAGMTPDPVLIEAIADILYTWIVSAKGQAMQTEYYRGILGQMCRMLECTEEARFANLPMEVLKLKTSIVNPETPA